MHTDQERPLPVVAVPSIVAVLLVAVPVFGVGVLAVLALISGATNRCMVLTGLCLVAGSRRPPRPVVDRHDVPGPPLTAPPAAVAWITS